MNGIVLIGVLLAAGAPQIDSEGSVYAVKPWATPAIQEAIEPVEHARSATSRALQSTAEVTNPAAWPDASQSILHKFVCENHPNGFAYDNAECGKAVSAGK